MIKIGQKVPDLDLQVFQNEEIKNIRLRDYKGQWLVVVFYPADFTFICPTELEDLQEKYEEFKASNAEILSISTDTVFVHKAWHDSSDAIGKIEYPMGSDTNGKISKKFGTYIKKEGLSLRGSFIIDPDSILKAFEIHDNNIGRSADELLRKLQAAKFVAEADGDVCPANWKPGAATLHPGLDLVGKI
ncbi:MAG: redoxin domain-containing protein [Melioribacteraceae bacterium]|jgi:peroxiredoxin|nr:redoxin domain-containing protein [Melioribacteraceae bacterium]